MIRIAIPGLLVLLVVAALVGAATWNRSSSPRQTLVVTEHELSLPSNMGPGGDDAGVQLRIAIEPRHDALDARNWLSDDRLRALGFSLDVPVGSPDAAEAYDNVPPRIGWLVLEYGGAAYQEIERRRAMKRDAQQWRDPRPPTRLVPVDAGGDYDALVAKYATGHLILRAIFALTYIPPTASGPLRGPLLYGWVRELVPAAVSVPRHLRPVVDGLSPRGVSPDGSLPPPRYDAELATGALGVPYLRGLRRLE